ncbi:MAG: hypothetical protein IJ160_07345 [Muribaculaceae bacterium]|nr:hypothetical protein [Muribaculaceae bacterium]
MLFFLFCAQLAQILRKTFHTEARQPHFFGNYGIKVWKLLPAPRALTKLFVPLPAQAVGRQLACPGCPSCPSEAVFWIYLDKMLTLGHQRAGSHGSRLIAFLAAPQQIKQAFLRPACTNVQFSILNLRNG